MSDRISFQNIVDHMNGAGVPYQANIPDNWRQGRTAYGGITSGLALAATRDLYPDLPPLRSAQITFVGPVAEDPVIIPTKLRQGRNVTAIETHVKSGDDVSAICVLLFGAGRKSHISVDLSSPDVSPPASYEPMLSGDAKAFAPVFFRNFDTRLIAGGLPMMGQKEGYIRTWCRHADETSRYGVASFLCIGDVLPPAAMPMFTRMGPISSMNWHINILVDDVVTQEGWWHIETKQSAARNGYSSQIMRYWNTDGVLVAEAIQSVAIFV